MKNKHLLVFTLMLLAATAIVSCEQLEPTAPAGEEVLDGEIEGLTPAQKALFLKGDAAFNEVFTSAKGLGPLFLTNSCVSCHAGDGKGHPFSAFYRFGQSDNTGNLYLNMGGPQLQHRALPGYQPESIPPGATFSKFTPPAVTGLGFLQYITDADILAMADPNDADGDGISGVPNWITPKDFITPSSTAVTQNGMYIHRFGKKAASYDLLDQTVGAYNQDMGITSSFDLIDTYSGLSTDPEVSDNSVRAVVTYLLTLKAPVPRNQNDPQVISGKSIFSQINCASCHKPTLTTGYAPIAALSYKEFYPYTDLLLHDMGSGLDDGYTEGNALSSEWRTPPLWGLGLSPSAQGGQYFLMHDGRAKSIGEAILLHGGEAENSKNLFLNLSETEKADLIKFLKAL